MSIEVHAHDFDLANRLAEEHIPRSIFSTKRLVRVIKLRTCLYLLLRRNTVASDFEELAKKYPLNTEYHIEHDGFKGVVIGYYRTLEGKLGVVLQLNNAKVVHVYGEKWLRALT